MGEGGKGLTFVAHHKNNRPKPYVGHCGMCASQNRYTRNRRILTMQEVSHLAARADDLDEARFSPLLRAGVLVDDMTGNWVWDDTTWWEEIDREIDRFDWARYAPTPLRVPLARLDARHTLYRARVGY